MCKSAGSQSGSDQLKAYMVLSWLVMAGGNVESRERESKRICEHRETSHKCQVEKVYRRLSGRPLSLLGTSGSNPVAGPGEEALKPPCRGLTFPAHP